MKKTIIGITALVAAFIVYSADVKTGHSNPSGAPAGASGSPSDGGLSTGTCMQSNCHNGSAVAQTGMITSDIPNTGYVPGTTYTINASIVASGKVRFGFEVSPQDASGNKMGTIIVTNSTETKTLSAGKYITHKTAGNGGSGSRTWSFNWTAPAAGSGDVTFYGSLMAANNNGNEGGDNVFASTLTVIENVTPTGVEEHQALSGLTLYPNPTNGNFKLAINNAKTAVETRVFTTDGKLVYNQTTEPQSNGTQTVDLALNGKLTAGIYFAVVKAGSVQKVIKFVVE